MSLKNSPNFLQNLSEIEMNDGERHFYHFRSFQLDIEERRLIHDGETLALTPKVFDVLAALVTRAGHLVEKDELLQIVWTDSFVEEANITRAIHTLRGVLGAEESGEKFIETVAKRGYRFVAEVERICLPLEMRRENGNQLFAFAETPKIIFAEPFAAEQPTEIAFQSPTDKTEDFKTAAPPAVQIKRSPRFVLLAVSFLSAIALVLLLSFNRQPSNPVKSNDSKSVAILPVKSLRLEDRDAIYELGIADALINRLNQFKDLQVRPLSATSRYTELQQDAAAAGREQQVDYVLASNYQIADGRIRITSQWINVSSGVVEDVFTEDQEVMNKFAMQDAVAANIGQKLLSKLNRPSNNFAANRYRNNEEVYRNYLLATALVDKRNVKDAEKAIEYLEQAIKLDPNYALAYVRLADAHSVIAAFNLNTANDQYPKARAAIEKALAIDGNLAEAYANSGEIKMNYDWDFDAAERAMKKAIELDPNSAKAHRFYSLYLNTMGRFDESIEEIKTAIDLEPAAVWSHRILGSNLYFARRYDEAIAELERTVEIDHNFRTSYSWLIRSYRMKGEDDKAFEWFLRSTKIKQNNNSEKIELWKKIYARSGWRGIYERQIEEVKESEKTGEDSSWKLATLYADLGDKEQAIVYLQKAFNSNRHNWAWTVIKIDPRNDLLRDDPRFQEIVKSVGLK